MIDAAYYLSRLSDRELIRYWELFHKYPTPDRRQREHLDQLLAEPPPPPAPKREADPPLLPLEVIVAGTTPQMDRYTPPPPVTARAPSGDRRRKDKGIAQPVARGGRPPQPVEDPATGQWWPSAVICADELGISASHVRDCCRGAVKGGRFIYSKRKTPRSAAA